MTGHIFDASFSPPTPASVVAVGGQGVARYLSSDPSKNLTVAEKNGYLAAGLTIVLIWEQGPEEPWHGGHPAGQADGIAARREADALGFDRTAVCYIALDDPTPAPAGVYPNIDDYARGFGEGWGSYDLMGGYGSDGAIEYVKAHGHVRYSWVVETWGADSDDNLEQMVNSHDLAHPSGSTDENRVLSADYGQWPRPTFGGEMPQRTDVMDTWVLPGSNGAIYCDLHADGGLFTYGGLDAHQLTYVAVSNLPQNRYNFGPAIGPAISYPDIVARTAGTPTPERDIFPTRWFCRMHVYSYGDKTYDVDPAAVLARLETEEANIAQLANNVAHLPPGPAGPPGPAYDDSAITGRITVVENDLTAIKTAIA